MSGMETALEKAIHVAGGVSRLAELLDQSPQVVSNWKTRPSGVPVERCPDIERVTRDLGSPVLCEELQPDVDWAVLRMPIKAAA